MVEPIEITDLADPRVDVYRDVRDADLRGREHLFMAESELVVRRLLRTPERLHSLFLSPMKYERLREAIDAARRVNAVDISDEMDTDQPQRQPHEFPIYLADVTLMSAIAGFHIHRGALAAGYRPSPVQLTLDSALGHLRGRDHLTILLAEGVTNVDNMGGLFRNAAAFGIEGIILDPTCCDPLYRKAIRVSVGHTLSVPYAVSKDWQGDLARLKEPPPHGWGLALLGAENDPHAVPLWDAPWTDNTGIVVGSEARGLDQATRAVCEALVAIPMAEDVPSLNVSTAAAVILYERRCADSSGPSKATSRPHVR